jgi:N-acetylglucosamine-6-phosphate deacetylase
MSSGEILAWHYATRKPARVAWHDGRINSITPSATSPARDVWLMPSLFDVQINGYAGIDFQQDGVTEAELLHAARALREDACARFFLTLTTDEWPRMMGRLRRYAELRRGNTELQQAIVGFHIEGPFLSREPGFHGAHDPAVMINPTPEHVREVRDIAGDVPLLLTLAPECPGALEAIALAKALGITISLGHTDAPLETLRAAVAAGATGFTHLANGCPRELDRHDNIIWRVAELHQLSYVSLIPDGIHVSPALFRVLIRDILRNRLPFYTTDAMAAAGAPPGTYRLGRLTLEVGADRIVRHPGRTNFAGSALRPIDGVRRAAAMVGWQWDIEWGALSSRPAEFVGVENGVSLNDPATFCLVEASGSSLQASTCWNGEWIEPRQP